MIETAALISGAVFLILHIIFFLGYLRSSRITQLPVTELPSVSVIVAARNEEKDICACIESLKNLKYPAGKLEIILVNDQSTDKTGEIMERETKGFLCFKILDTASFLNSKLTGKPRAIDIAIKQATGELLLMTDADCTVHENWAEETVRYFSQNKGMVCGFTKVDYTHSLFSKLQSIDWIYLQALATCSSGINLPLSCIGNNLSIRKETYFSVGGYENIKFSVTEDLALMRSIDKGNLYEVIYPLNAECLVTTKECRNINELYHQKKRWFRGGIGINLLGYLLGIELYIMNFIFLTGLFYFNPLIYSIMVFLKVISELIVILPVYNKFRYRGLIQYYLLFEFYFAIYGLLLPLTFIAGKKIRWKERRH